MKKFLFAIIILFSTLISAENSITVTSPNGGEHWQNGAVQDITWKITGTITNVKIQYSTDEGTTFTDIVSSTLASVGVYHWTVPSNFSNECLIKISDANKASVFGLSSNTFTIEYISLLTPHGGEVIQTGKLFDITWNSTQILNLQLDYTTNNGTSWNLIASPVNAGLGMYSWTVPNTQSTGCRVRISDATTTSVNDVSLAVFTIASLNIICPNGGENFLQGATNSITWSSQFLSTVNIDYSIDGGATFNSIATNLNAGTGSYPWTVPLGTLSTNCLIRILDSNQPTKIYDESNSTFTISTLSLTAPAAAVAWQGQTHHNITWTSTNVTNVKIDYSTDNGNTWTIISNSTSAAAGTYDWLLPNTPSFSCKIRISDLSYQSYNVVSGTFTIDPVPAIQVISPNGFEDWQEKSTHPISWTATYNIANVNVDYSTNNGINWIPVASNLAANLGTISWTVPSIFSQLCKVRVVNSANPALYDCSDNMFLISSLNITAPNGGERWQAGKSYNITWNSVNVSNIKIEYSTDNGASWNLAVSTVPASNNSYSWTPPAQASTTCKVRLSDVSNSGIQSVSGSPFTITSLTVTSPNGAENWLEGSLHAVTWISANIANVKLDYSSDSGNSWNPITASTPAAAGTYNWTVPCNSTPHYLVRASDASDATINDISDNEFVVLKINLVSPAGNENWKVGTSQNITWTSGVTVTNVKIEYSTNNGSSWILVVPSIVSNPGAVNSFRWITPNTTSINCKVRVSLVSSPDINSVNFVFFTISKSLNVKSPNGGENWTVGSSRNITWDRDPSINFIRIQYTSDNGLDWSDINTYVDASLGSYTWTMPNIYSPACLVRITDVNNVSNCDTSDSKFTILSTPTVSVTRPNGGEIFETGAQESITWNSTFITTVRIDYSIDNGTSWNLIASSLQSTGSYTWNVPNLKSNQCRIKITDEANTNVFDLSDAVFTINPRIVVTSPNGSENLPVASTFPITWASSNVANVKIDYSSDNGNGWTNIVLSTPASAGTYSWTVPSSGSAVCLIKISDASKPQIYDVSDNVFTISNKIAVLKPNGGESWQSGSSQTILWSSNGIANVSISFSTNNGVAWSNIGSATAGGGSYAWTVPAIAGNQYLVKISDATNPNVYDLSDGYFTVSSLSLKTPIGGENYPIGSTQSITWTSSYIGKVRLEYSIDNGLDWQLIADSLQSNGNFYWQVPNTPSAQCKVRISDSGNLVTNSISANNFSITEIPAVTVLYPNGKENFAIGKTETIKWKSSSVSNVKIEYSINSGTAWTTVTSSTPSTGTYPWTVPATLSNLCKVRISDTSRPGVSDVSDSVFTITNLPAITVLAPIGAENLPVGSIFTIKWSSSNVSNVKIDYTINGVDWTTIESSILSAGVYDWTVPNTPSVQCRIRVSDASNQAVCNMSPKLFTISASPYIRVTSPNGKESWQIGKTQSITWTSNNTNDVKIDYSINNGSTWSNVVADTKSTGAYPWIIPNTPSTQCRVRISDVLKSSVADASDSVFTITAPPNLTVRYPNGGESLRAGTLQNLTWTSTNVDSVKIEYSINNGVTWNAIVKSFPSTGIFIWTVPEVSSYQCLVRISGVSDNNIVDMSDNVFTIAVIDLITPIDGETILSSSAYNITWRSSGITNMKIEYTLNQGVVWITIAQSVSALTGVYAWSVPSGSMPQCRIKISDVSRPTIFDMNENDFSIKQIIVVSPVESSQWKVGSTQIIQWRSLNVANVKLEYTANNGAIWDTIAAKVPSSVGYYYWIVPDSPSQLCIVRISDASNQTMYATNRNNFGITDLTAVETNSGNEKPASYSLMQNYPNPFNPVTQIKYQIPSDGFTSLKIYDLLGREVGVLVNEEKRAGSYQVRFNGSSLSSGVYIYRLQSGSYTCAKKLILIK